jgi:hypothetical protein
VRPRDRALEGRQYQETYGGGHGGDPDRLLGHL